MKKLIFGLCLILTFFICGCQKSDFSKDEIEVLNALNECRIFYQDDDDENNVTKNVSFSLSSNQKVKCDIEVSDENLISKEGRVTRSEEDKIVIIKFIVSLNEVKYEKSFNLTVKKIEDNSGSGESENGNGEGEKENGQGEGGDSGNNQNQENGELASASFTGLEKGATPIIDGWTLNVSNKGAYDTGWLSLRNDKENIETPTFSKQTSVVVKFVYYMNNIGTTGNKSSKIKFSALNEEDQVVAEWISGELNFLNDGEKSGNTKYAKTLETNLDGEDIVKVKIEFVKDGGGNIGFSTITVNTNEQEG